MSDQESVAVAADDDAAATSATIDRMPKVRLDVLTSRVLHDQDYGEMSSSSSLSSASASEGDVGAATAVTAYDSMTRMPLSTLAKMEAQLKRPVLLSKGGLTVDFSAEDIRHITDAEVLRFLASSGEASSSPAPLTRPPQPPDASPCDMEAQMEALQREIDTFITAVDNEGRSYDIRVGASGHRQVFIGDEEPNAIAEENEVEAAASDSPPSPSSLQPESATLVPTDEKPGSAPSKPSKRLSHRPSLAASSRQPRPATEKSARVGRAPARFAPSPPPARASSSRAALPSASPAIAVRPQAGLTEAEEVRVEQLLDDEAIAVLESTNPFACGGGVAERLGELEREINRYVAARGGHPGSFCLGTASASSDDVVTDRRGAADVADAAALEKGTTAKTAVELGNAYMRRVRQSELAAQKMRAVNERLRALQRCSEALALASSDDTPLDILAMRPVWAQPSASLSSSESAVQQLLAAARVEEARARDAGLTIAVPPTTDPFVALRDALRGAGSRAAELLRACDASPLALRGVPELTDEDVDGTLGNE